MDERYRASEAQASDIVEALASDDITVLQDNKFKDIHCLLSALSKSVTSALAEVALHLRVIGDNGTVTNEAPVLQSILDLQSVSREIGHSCFCSSERSQNKCLIPSDRPLLTTLYTAGQTEIISENDSKSVVAFENSGVDSELKCETFLQDVVNLAKSKQLSEAACKNLLYRKLQAAARALLDSHLDLHGVVYANVSLTDVFRLAEFLFMQKSNPRAAMLSLTKLPRLAAHDKNFQRVQAVISRLCKISVLNEPNAAVRAVLYQTRCLSAFNGCITQKDRALLESANTTRVAANLGTLTLSGALQYLTQRYQDEAITQEAPCFAPPDSLSTLQVSLMRETNIWLIGFLDRGEGGEVWDHRVRT